MEEILEGEEVIILQAFWLDDRNDYNKAVGTFIRKLHTKFYLIDVSGTEVIAWHICKATPLNKALL